MTVIRRDALAAAALLALAGPAFATGRSPSLDARIAEHAARHGVPERLVHRVIVRESRYQPRVVSRGNYGLMQIKPATARGMGYRGAPGGLLDAETNLTYAVPYLANAWRVAGGNEDRAVALYAGGYYYVAKRRGMLAQLRTAQSPASGATATADAMPAANVLAAAAPDEAEEAPAAPGSPDLAARR